MAYPDNQITWSPTNVSPVGDSSSSESDSGPLTNTAYTRLALRPTTVGISSSKVSAISDAVASSIPTNRPLTVGERRAFFEKLHAAASTDIPDNIGITTTTTTTTATTATCATTTSASGKSFSSAHRRLYLAKQSTNAETSNSFKVSRESTDAKENVVPESLLNVTVADQQLLCPDSSYNELLTTEVLSNTAELQPPLKKAPPAKPKRTFIYERELLQQSDD
uniref:Uncharacterized protein n=1 Tax=Syphacia muris TaxID=451379 RepID=A0A0N5AT70_9BILA